MKYQNNQLYSECQLVSIWNAARFLETTSEINIPQMGSDKYLQILDSCRCIYGGCIVSDYERERVGLKRIKGKMDLNFIINNLPYEFTLHCHRGYHSVLGIKVKDNKILLTNYAIGRLYWLNWETVKEKQNKHLEGFYFIKDNY